MSAIKIILTDIEGTTTPISFVKDVLFPFASKHLGNYVLGHINHPIVRECVLSANETAKSEFGVSLDTQGIIALFLKWIEEDRKHTALKTLQGLIWEEGYKAGAFVSEVYPDVPEYLKKWHNDSYSLAIYSSGSVSAQKLLFSYTNHGNLLPLFSYFFDTEVGGKREQKSYETIATSLQRSPQQILFLSDIAEELAAAKSAGMNVMQLLRPGTAASDFQTAVSFADVDKFINNN